MKISEELREKMWELCYDLLPDDDRRALVAQIKSDPQAARLYAEVRLQADLVGFAAKVEDSSLILSADLEKLEPGNANPAGGRRKEAVLAPAVRSHQAPAAGGRVWVSWLPAAAALLLVALIAYGVYRPHASQDPMIFGLVSTEIEMPGQMQEGLSSKLIVRSHSPEGTPVSADVEVKFVDSAGSVRHQEVIRTDAGGVAAVNAPGSAVQRGVRVEALARRQLEADGVIPEQQVTAQLDAVNQLEPTSLPVQPHAPLTYYLQETPVAEPGQETRFALYSMSRFGLEAQPAEVEELVVAGPDGEPIGQPMWTRNNGFVEGSFVMPDDSQAGQYSLAFRSKEARDDRLGGVAERFSTTDLALLQQREQQHFFEMGRPRSRMSTPAPAARPNADDKTLEQVVGKETSDARTSDAAYQQRKQTGEQEVLEQNAKQLAVKPEGDNNARDAIVAAGSSSASAPVYEAGEPVTLSFPAELVKSRNAVVEAYSRGVRVASRPLSADFDRASGREDDLKTVAAKDDSATSLAETEVARRQVAIDLPPEADGLVHVKLVDISKSPPQVLSQQTVYRQPSRMLKVALADTQNQFQPGEQVKLRLRVLNEHDQAAPATLGVRVWSESHIEASGREPVLLADAVRSYSLAESEEQPVQLARLGKSLRELDMLAHDERRELSREFKKAEATFDAPAATAPAPASPAATPPAPQEPAAPVRDVAPRDRASADSVRDQGERADRPELRAGGAAPIEPGLAPPSGPQAEGAVLGEKAESDEVAEMLAEAYYAPRPLVASNQGTVQQKYRALTAENDKAWQAWRATVGGVLVAGGLVALGVILMLFLVKTPVRAASGTLTLLAAAASLIVGAFWISGHERQAMQIAAVPPAEIREDSKAPAGDAERGEAAFGHGYMLEDQVRLNLDPASGSLAKDSQQNAPAPASTLAPAPTTAGGAPSPSAGTEGFGSSGLESLPKPGARAEGYGGGGLSRFAQEGQSNAQGGERMIAPGGVGGGQAGRPLAEADKPLDELDARLKADEAKAQAAASASAPSATRQSKSGSAGPAPRGGPGVDRRAGATEEKAAAPLAAATPLPAEQPGDGALGLSTRQNRGLAKQANELAVPASLYFNPRLATDAEGYATIEFTMPDAESDYRVLIDAFGQGRIGSAEVTIMGRRASGVR